MRPSSIQLFHFDTWIQIHDLPIGYAPMIKSLLSKLVDLCIQRVFPMISPETEGGGRSSGRGGFRGVVLLMVEGIEHAMAHLRLNPLIIQMKMRWKRMMWIQAERELLLPRNNKII
jgi:hypothetical protein